MSTRLSSAYGLLKQTVSKRRNSYSFR
jgi:hypothetical protein